MRRFCVVPDSDVVIHRADRPLREILGVALAGLLHRELIAVEVVAEGAAEVFFGAAQDGFEDAGVGRADGFVLLGLQAELAQPLDVLEGGEYYAADGSCWH